MTARPLWKRFAFGFVFGSLTLFSIAPLVLSADDQPEAPVFAYQTVHDAGGIDSGRKIAVDGRGNAFVLGHSDREGIVVLKVSPNGEVLFSESFGYVGSFGTDIAVDGDGNPLLTGWTSAPNFPVTPDAFQPQLAGPSDAFLLKLSGAGGAVLYGTYFGASRQEYGHGVTVDEVGRIYLAGATDSADFPTAHPVQEELNLEICFCDDAFVSVFSPDGGELLFSTYWGGRLTDAAGTIAVDVDGNIVFAGETESDDFPLVRALQTGYGGETDGFAAKFLRRALPDGSRVAYSTYLGGGELEYVRGVVIDGSGAALVAGTTRSADFPTTPDAFQPVFVGAVNGCGQPPFDPTHNCEDMFVSKITATGELAFGTYLGSTIEDLANDVAVDATGNVYVIGHTNSTDYPGSDPHQYAICTSRLDPSGESLHGTLFIQSPVYNQGHGIALGAGGRNIFLTAAQNVPADTYVARIRR